MRKGVCKQLRRWAHRCLTQVSFVVSIFSELGCKWKRWGMLSKRAVGLDSKPITRTHKGKGVKVPQFLVSPSLFPSPLSLWHPEIIDAAPEIAFGGGAA